MKIVAISGGFDPLHNGHMNLIDEAQEYGHVVAILNSDKWLVAKKGRAFLDWNTRARILRKMGLGVIQVCDEDGTVCEALERLRPDYFANGGDRKVTNTPEIGLCKKLGVEMLFNIGGDKIASSSQLLSDYNRSAQ